MTKLPPGRIHTVKDAVTKIVLAEQRDLKHDADVIQESLRAQASYGHITGEEAEANETEKQMRRWHAAWSHFLKKFNELLKEEFPDEKA